MLKKTSRQSLTEQIAEQIEHLIESGEWPVGTRIPPEPQLMEELQVSRNTLRESIKALTHAGLLKTRQGDGTYVSASSALGPVLHKRVQKTDFIRSLEVRYALEREAAYLAANRRTEQDLEQIRSCLKNRNEAIRNQEYETFAEWDVEFHRAIVAATRNDLLMDIYEHVTGALKEMVTELSDISDADGYFQDTHEQLMRAIEDQDQALAVEAVHNYIEESKLYFTQLGGSNNEING